MQSDFSDVTEGVLTEKAAQEVFDELKNDEDFFWEYLDDGCFARVHKVCSLLHAKGIYSEKIRADNAERTWLCSFGLAIRKEDMPEEFIYIHFRNAVVIRVRTACGIEERIVDPGLFDGPVTQQQWAEKLINRQSIRPDGTIDPSLQDKKYTRTAWDVFEKGLFWTIKDMDLNKTNTLLARHRKDAQRKTSGVPCVGCGFCCIKSPCPLAVKMYDLSSFYGGVTASCPVLSWNGERHICAHAEQYRGILAIGKGCLSLNSWREEIRCRV